MTTEPKPVKAWAIVVRETGEIYDGGSSYMPIRLKRLGSLSHSRLKYVRVLITPIGPTPKKVVAVSVPMPKDRLYKTVIRNPIGRNPTPKKGKRK